MKPGVLAGGADDRRDLTMARPRPVADTCGAVGENRAAISADAARMGGHISRMDLMTPELTACEPGRSRQARRADESCPCA